MENLNLTISKLFLKGIGSIEMQNHDELVGSYECPNQDNGP